MDLCINASINLPAPLSIYVCMYACMRVLYLSLFLVVCLSICSLSNVISLVLPSVSFYLSVCLCWAVVHFELALNKWPEESFFYPNKGSPGDLLQHENNSTGLNKRRLIHLKPSGLLQIYLSFSWSIFLTTYRYMPIYLAFFLSAHLSTIYLHYSTVLIIPL